MPYRLVLFDMKALFAVVGGVVVVISGLGMMDVLWDVGVVFLFDFDHFAAAAHAWI